MKCQQADLNIYAEVVPNSLGIGGRVDVYHNPYILIYTCLNDDN